MNYSTITHKFLQSMVLSVLIFAGNTTHAQDQYPSKPISLIVPYGPGGSTDQLARALGEGMSKQLKQPVIIEFKPGAGGTLGAAQMVRTKPDGYSLTMLPISVFRQPYLQTVNYDPLKDLSYIATVSNYTYAIAVMADAKWKTINELVEDAKANPGKFSYSGSAQFSSNHLSMVEIGRIAGIEWTFIPYKGDAEGLTALFGGHVQVVASTSTVLPFMKSGKVRVLATVGDKRPADFADAPTLQEAGFPVVMHSPLGIAGPAGLPPDIIEKLDQAIAATLRDPKFKESMAALGIELSYRDHKEYAAYAVKTFAQEKTIIERLSKETQK